MTKDTPQVLVISELPITSLKLSNTPGQVERRKRFDKAALEELAANIKQIGIMQPVVVREIPGRVIGRAGPTHEVIAGERRVVAAGKAGLLTVPVTVRDVSDEQLIEFQLVENLQREGLHELAEAEGYEQLMKQYRYSTDQIAEKIGKSKAYVYARVKLLALCPEARRAFYDDKLNASTALLVARIPDHNLQRQAMKEITKPRHWDDVPMTFREAARHVHEKYMLRLDQAPFPTSDSDLVASAGPCGACPKRTGNQRELFGDVKSADVCTDPICFASKRDANLVRLSEKAKASGKDVIAGAEAKKIAPQGVDRYSSLKGFVRLDEQHYLGSSYRTYRSALGKDVKALEVKYLQDPESGKLVEIVAEADMKAALKKRGFKDRSGGDNTYQAQQRAAERKAKLERSFRSELYRQIRAKLPTSLGKVELLLVARQFIKAHRHDQQKELLKIWGLEAEKGRHGGWNCEKPLFAHLAKATERELARYVLDLAYLDDLLVFSYSSEKPEQLLEAARRHKVNAPKIRREIEAAARAKTKPAKKRARKAA